MRRRVILLGLVACAAAALLILAPDREALVALPIRIREAGALGVGGIVAAYLLASLLVLPVWPLTVAAGAAWGAARGFGVALPAAVAGASLAFAVGRTLLRGAVERRLGRDPRLAALDAAVDRQGPVLVLLVRLSPLFPYNVVNYALSATRLRLRTFAAASLAGMAPITFAWTWAGANLGAAAGLSGGAPPGPAGQLLRWGGLAATVAAIALLARAARRALPGAGR